MYNRDLDRGRCEFVGDPSVHPLFATTNDDYRFVLINNNYYNNNNNNNNNNLFTYNAQVSIYIFTCVELNSFKKLITSTGCII